MLLERETRNIGIICNSKVVPPNIEEVLSSLTLPFLGRALLVGVSDVLRCGRWIWNSSGCRCAPMDPGSLVLFYRILITSMESVKTKDLYQALSLLLTEKESELVKSPV